MTPLLLPCVSRRASQCSVYSIYDNGDTRLISVEFQRRLCSHGTVYIWSSVVASGRHPERKQSKAKRYSKGTRTSCQLLRPAQDQRCKWASCWLSAKTFHSLHDPWTLSCKYQACSKNTLVTTKACHSVCTHNCNQLNSSHGVD